MESRVEIFRNAFACEKTNLQSQSLILNLQLCPIIREHSHASSVQIEPVKGFVQFC